MIRVPFSLEGRVALVTGATRGIGRAIALELARAGARVALLGRDREALSVVAAEVEAVGDQTLVLPADVAVPEQVEGAVGLCRATLGPVDVLVNNAGAVSRGSIQETDLESWETALRVNLTGAYLCSRAVAPAMCERRWGRIINIASITAQTGGVSGSVSYSAAKGGLLAFTRTLARDLAPYGVTVNAVAPGQIDTRMSEALTAEQLQRLVAMIPVGRLGTPEEVAYTVRFLASDEAAYITGATLDVNGGVLKR